MSKYLTKMYALRCLSKLVCEESEHTLNQESYIRKALKYSRIVFLELQIKKKKEKRLLALEAFSASRRWQKRRIASRSWLVCYFQSW